MRALPSLTQTPGERRRSARPGGARRHGEGPTFVQRSEALGAHGEVRGEPQGEDGPRADDGGGQLKPRQPEFKKNTQRRLESRNGLLKLV